MSTGEFCGSRRSMHGYNLSNYRLERRNLLIAVIVGRISASNFPTAEKNERRNKAEIMTKR